MIQEKVNKNISINGEVKNQKHIGVNQMLTMDHGQERVKKKKIENKLSNCFLKKIIFSYKLLIPHILFFYLIYIIFVLRKFILVVFLFFKLKKNKGKRFVNKSSK